MGLRFGLLGPVQVLHVHDEIAPPALKQRTLLTALLMQPNRAVPLDRLIHILWGDSPPKSVVANLRTYVNRLRCRLARFEGGAGPERIRARRPGYLIRVDDGELDSQVFTAHQRRANDALDRGDLRTALRELTSALDLWRGDSAEDVPRSPELEPRLAALDEQRWSVRESHAQVRLALGGGEDLVCELRTLLADNPVRERLWVFLMAALYRAGNAAAALEAFHQARRALDEALGIEPGGELVELQRRILNRAPLPQTPWSEPTLSARHEESPGARPPGHREVRPGVVA